MMLHRWSGWPGAWCLDCGCEDPIELALANDTSDPTAESFMEYVRKEYKDHPGLKPCKEPNSHNNDPYYHRK